MFFRYVEPQWQLLVPNNTANLSQLQTEECLDGWTFDRSEFLATTVSEVTRKKAYHFKTEVNEEVVLRERGTIPTRYKYCPDTAHFDVKVNPRL